MSFFCIISFLGVNKTLFYHTLLLFLHTNQISYSQTARKTESSSSFLSLPHNRTSTATQSTPTIEIHPPRPASSADYRPPNPADHAPTERTRLHSSETRTDRLGTAERQRHSSSRDMSKERLRDGSKERLKDGSKERLRHDSKERGRPNERTPTAGEDNNISGEGDDGDETTCEYLEHT